MMKLDSALTLIFLMSMPGVAVAEGHCSADERVLFSCGVGKKAVSVCASGAGLQYRFGPIGAPELKYPANASGYKSLVSRGALTFNAGGAAYLRFVNGDYQYIVYSGEGRGWAQEGLVAVKDGKVVVSKKCAGLAAGDLDVQGKLVTNQDDEVKAFDVWELVPIDE